MEIGDGTTNSLVTASILTEKQFASITADDTELLQ